MTMTAASIPHALADLLHVPVDPIEGGRPGSAPVEGDFTVEFRWIAELPALCLAVPLGHVLRGTQAEVLAGSLSANLYLADHGCPHYALGPQQDTLYLCLTLSGDPFDAVVVEPALTQLLDIARQSRTNLRQVQALA